MSQILSCAYLTEIILPQKCFCQLFSSRLPFDTVEFSCYGATNIELIEMPAAAWFSSIIECSRGIIIDIGDLKLYSYSELFPPRSQNLWSWNLAKNFCFLPEVELLIYKKCGWRFLDCELIFLNSQLSSSGIFITRAVLH